jgi:hypothetical protein
MELTPAPLSSETRRRLVERIVSDTDSVVAAVAGQVVCADHVDREESAAIDRAMTKEAIARLRTVVADASISAEVRVEGARCLARDKDPASAAAIRALSTTAPAYLRKALRSMTGASKGKPRKK